MRTFAKIIVEKSDGQWKAWFEQLPLAVFHGGWSAYAIERLLAHFGTHEFDVEEMITVESAATEMHLEYLIPIRHLRTIPSPSAN